MGPILVADLLPAFKPKCRYRKASARAREAAAAAAERLLGMPAPLVTLTIPLVRSGPPRYRRQVRWRISRWYRNQPDLERRGGGAAALPTART